jgi:hypothetical protein
VLGNLFIQLGIARMEMAPSGAISVESAAQLVIQDLKNNGESTANALARQGIILLTWIEKKKED